MPHIHTDPAQHDLTVTGYVVRLDGPKPRALVHMHRKLHKLLPIGGHVELTETPWQALAHELREESGYELADLTILQPTPRLTRLSDVAFHPYPLSMNTHSITLEHFHTDIEYGLVATTGPRLSVQEGESVDLRWYTQEELAELDQSLIYTNTVEVYEFIFRQALLQWEQVSPSQFTLH